MDRLCPHCPNAILDTDTVCCNCGEEVALLKPDLVGMAKILGIPYTFVREEQELTLKTIRLDEEGMHPVYIAEGKVHNVDIKVTFTEET